MNILIINAFGSSSKSKARFESFCNLIKHLFKKISKDSGIDNFNFICRSPNHISEFLFKYDMISGDVNQNKKHKKNFDKLDMVIIDGYEKYSPWGNKSFILCEFIKLCKITNKILYAGGVALEILIYYLSTDSLNEYNFVNSTGQIKALEEMVALPQKYVKELKNNDMFLDFVTGDILEYKNNKTWVPIKNIGLHKQLTAEKYMNRGKFVLPYNFKGKDNIKNEFAFVTICNEIKVKITRQYLHHCLVENLPLEFIAITSLTWFPHFINVNNKELQFKVICESQKGPVVIEHQNSTGVLFHISDKYQGTVIFLENFIRNKFNEVQNKIFKFKNMTNNPIVKTDKGEMPLLFKTYNSYGDIRKAKIKTENVILNNRKTNLDKVNNSRAFNRIKKIKSEASHVGFGINNRDMIFVENNYINQNPIFSMDMNKKNKMINLLYDDNIEFNKNNLFQNKKKKSSNLLEFKNSDEIYENKDKTKKKINNITSLKGLHILIDNKNQEKRLSKKNLFTAYNKQKNLNLNNKNKIFQSNLYFQSRNKNNKKKIRFNSTNIFNKTENNYHKKMKNFKNEEYEMYPLISDTLKMRKYNYTKSNEKEIDENYNEVFIPKYPRPANINTENEKKSLDNNLDILLQMNNKNNQIITENNNYNNNIYNKNYNMTNYPKKKVYLFNKKINFNGLTENKNQP